MAGSGDDSHSEVLTAEEAAELLHLSANAVRRASAAGEIPCARVGRRFRYSRQALLAWMQQPIDSQATG